ncbi:MAG TPA: methionine aminotransferase, partial [Algoriphagus sp.]|nr:methionine aminotransferase [Algoriphagus sp.]
ACIPVSSFYQYQKDDKIIRFCFAKENSDLEEALVRLKNLGDLFKK